MRVVHDLPRSGTTVSSLLHDFPIFRFIVAGSIRTREDPESTVHDGSGLFPSPCADEGPEVVPPIL